MKKLKEINYDQIFSPETMASLKGKSADSMRQLLGNKNLIQVLTRSSQLIPELIEAEKDYVDELEMVAVQLCKDAFPIIDYAGILIDAKIETEEIVQQGPPQEPKEVKEKWEEIPGYKRRRIINGITQGASIRGAFWFMLFKEHKPDIQVNKLWNPAKYYSNCQKKHIKINFQFINEKLLITF